MKIWALFLVSLFLTHTAEAHSINVTAFVEGRRIETSTYYTSGHKVSGATIEVFDAASEKIILTGITDENGDFAFDAPGQFDLKIVVTDKTGHRAEAMVHADELSEADSTNLPAHKEVSAPDTEEQKAQAGSNFTGGISKEELEAVVEAKLDKKLAPIHRLLKESLQQRARPSMHDVIGGIGYIFGLFGVSAYFLARKK
jgi:nickel transport protein